MEEKKPSKEKKKVLSIMNIGGKIITTSSLLFSPLVAVEQAIA
jgi:hypothetical protein